MTLKINYIYVLFAKSAEPRGRRDKMYLSLQNIEVLRLTQNKTKNDAEAVQLNANE